MEDTPVKAIQTGEEKTIVDILTVDLVKHGDLLAGGFISSEQDIEISEDGKMALVYK